MVHVKKKKKKKNIKKIIWAKNNLEEKFVTNIFI